MKREIKDELTRFVIVRQIPSAKGGTLSNVLKFKVLNMCKYNRKISRI